MIRWHPEWLRISPPIILWIAIAAQAGVPTVAHRLEELSYSAHRDFGRVALGFRGGIPEYRLSERPDGTWVLTLHSTTADGLNPEVSNRYVERVKLDRKAGRVELVLVPASWQGVQVQAIRKGRFLLLDLLPPAGEVSADRLYRRATRALEQNRPEEALRDLRDWLRLHPEDHQAEFQTGRAYLALGDLESAREFLLRASRAATLRKEVAKLIGSLTPPAKEATSTNPGTPRKLSDTTPEPLPSPQAPSDSTSAAPVVSVPEVGHDTVLRLLALPLLVAVGVTTGLGWILIRKQKRLMKVRQSPKLDFTEQLSGSIAGEHQPAYRGASDGQTSNVASNRPVEVPARSEMTADMEPVAKLFLPLNHNEIVRVSLRGSEQLFRKRLKELVDSVGQESDLQEMARYLDVGLAELELARKLAHCGPHSESDKSSETKSNLRIGFLDDS